VSDKHDKWAKPADTWGTGRNARALAESRAAEATEQRDIVYPCSSLGELERVVDLLMALPGVYPGVERDRDVQARIHQFVVRFANNCGADTRVIVELSHSFCRGRGELPPAVFERVTRAR